AVIMGPRNGVPATHSASQTRVNALLLSRGAPREDDRWPNDPWLRLAKMRGASRPHAEERRSATRAQAPPQPKCAAMRLEALRRTQPHGLILRDAHTHVRVCETSSARALLRMRTNIAYCIAHHLKQPISFPRRIFASGLCNFASLTPNRGVGGAPRVVRVQRHPLGVHITRHARRLARRLASHDAGRSPLGAPPWRFWASGPRFRLLRRPPSYNGGHLPSGSVQRAPRSQVVVPGGRLPGPPGANGYKPP